MSHCIFLSSTAWPLCMCPGADPSVRIWSMSSKMAIWSRQHLFASPPSVSLFPPAVLVLLGTARRRPPQGSLRCQPPLLCLTLTPLSPAPSQSQPPQARAGGLGWGPLCRRAASALPLQAPRILGGEAPHLWRVSWGLWPSSMKPCKHLPYGPCVSWVCSTCCLSFPLPLPHCCKSDSRHQICKVLRGTQGRWQLWEPVLWAGRGGGKPWRGFGQRT